MDSRTLLQTLSPPGSAQAQDRPSAGPSPAKSFSRQGSKGGSCRRPWNPRNSFFRTTANSASCPARSRSKARMVSWQRSEDWKKGFLPHCWTRRDSCSAKASGWRNRTNGSLQNCSIPRSSFGRAGWSWASNWTRNSIGPRCCGKSRNWRTGPTNSSCRPTPAPTWKRSSRRRGSARRAFSWADRALKQTMRAHRAHGRRTGSQTLTIILAFGTAAGNHRADERRKDPCGKNARG